MTTDRTTRLPASAAGANGFRALISEAWEATAVVADDVEPSTREAAFTLVLEAMLRKQAPPPPAAPAVPNDDQPGDEIIDVLYATPGQRSEAIASYLEIAGTDAEALYDVAGPAPRLRRVPHLECVTEQQAHRKIALLVCAGRTAIALDTGTEHIREAVVRLTGANIDPVPVLDGAKEFSLRGRPDSPNRLVRLTGWGLGAARDVAQGLVWL